MQQTLRPVAHPAYRVRRRTPLSAIADRCGRTLARAATAQSLVAGLARDVFTAMRNADPAGEAAARIRHVETITPLSVRSGKLCLYAAYSPRAVVTPMVAAQLQAYRDAGYQVVFISMSAAISPADRNTLRSLCSHIVHRHSYGRDFGAWLDAVAVLGEAVTDCEQLLLTNDSCLGPLKPLAPWIARAESRDGLVGLTENLGGGSHLQSYFLLANGRPTVRTVVGFLRAMRLSHSKFLMVRRGEIAISATLPRAGIPVSALVDNESIEQALLTQRAYQAELALMCPHLFRGQLSLSVAQLPPRIRDDELDRILAFNRLLLRRRLFAEPLNPCYQLLPLLLDVFAFPFVKADLVLRNPGRFPSVPDWRYAITPHGTITEAVIDDHLASLA